MRERESIEGRGIWGLFSGGVGVSRNPDRGYGDDDDYDYVVMSSPLLITW